MIKITSHVRAPILSDQNDQRSYRAFKTIKNSKRAIFGYGILDETEICKNKCNGSTTSGKILGCSCKYVRLLLTHSVQCILVKSKKKSTYIQTYSLHKGVTQVEPWYFYEIATWNMLRTHARKVNRSFMRKKN